MPSASAVPYLIKWAGGKRTLASEIDGIRRGLGAERILEPFFGGGGYGLYALANDPSAKLYAGDIEADLINFWRAVRMTPNGLVDQLKSFPGPSDESWKDHYYDIRAEYNEGLPWNQDPLRRAAMFLWLNRAGFNGLYRRNKTGGFNVPAGSYKTVKVPDPDTILAASRLLSGRSNLQIRSFEILSDAAPPEFVYADPPYFQVDFTKYGSRDAFGKDDLHKLLETGLQYIARGALAFVLSNTEAAAPVVREFLAEQQGRWQSLEIRPVQGVRNIGRNGSGRKRASDILAIIK